MGRTIGAVGQKPGKSMTDTIPQALELKVLGFRAFASDEAGDTMVQLIFVDDRGQHLRAQARSR